MKFRKKAKRLVGKMFAKMGEALSPDWGRYHSEEDTQMQPIRISVERMREMVGLHNPQRIFDRLTNPSRTIQKIKLPTYEDEAYDIDIHLLESDGEPTPTPPTVELPPGSEFGALVAWRALEVADWWWSLSPEEKEKLFACVKLTAGAAAIEFLFS